MTLLDNYFQVTPPNGRQSSAIAYLAALDHLHANCPDVARAIIQELRDQRSYLKLIASENYSSLAVQLAMGNLLTDKYAEGYAHHRFYAGCENVDAIEEYAQLLLKQLFGADAAYAQPHSGADANLVAFWAILVQRVQNAEVERLGHKSVDELSPEEYERVRQLIVSQKLMGLSLNSGGHLTHGYRHNISSKIMQSVSYDVDPATEQLDYAALRDQAIREKPAILLAGYSAYPRLINFAVMREIADAAGAVLMVDMAHFAGLVAGKVLCGDYDPVPHAHIVTSTTHKTLRGPRGGIVLCSKEYADIVNKGCPLVLGGPLPHVMAAKAVAFKEALSDDFKNYARQIVVNCKALAARFQARGVRLVSGGTDNHLLVMDLTSFGITGRQAEALLRQAFLTVNRNAIPFDRNGSWYTSGLRLGPAALTSRGMGCAEMEQIADLTVELLAKAKPAITSSGEPSKVKVDIAPEVVTEIQDAVKELLGNFPLYKELLII
jgi:glycine hydroxymethyltransferase